MGTIDTQWDLSLLQLAAICFQLKITLHIQNSEPQTFGEEFSSTNCHIAFHNSSFWTAQPEIITEPRTPEVTLPEWNDKTLISDFLRTSTNLISSQSIDRASKSLSEQDFVFVGQLRCSSDWETFVIAGVKQSINVALESKIYCYDTKIYIGYTPLKRGILTTPDKEFVSRESKRHTSSLERKIDNLYRVLPTGKSQTKRELLK